MTDRQITLSIGASRRSTQWTPATMWWSEFVERLRVPTRGTETLEQYMALSKGRQDDLKDVGGYVGGTLLGGRRKASAVQHRDLITLDLDNIPAGGTEDALRRIASTGVACVVYSTRKHAPHKPRLRAVFLMDTPRTGDEYEPIARKLAVDVGLELCDPTTFEASRLMYWPSCSIDSEYIWQPIDGGLLDTDATLALYKDWHDVNEWPRVPGEEKRIRHADKLGDPTAKDGIVGAFCRSYDVYSAIETFLLGVYVPTDLPDRLSYSGGSTTGGAVIYDNGLFLYSHHATDPCSGREVNSFDLVRLHLFGDQDDDATPGCPVANLPSYKAMCDFALRQPEVAAAINQAKIDRATQDFAAVTGQAPAAPADWGQLLTVSPSGHIQKTINNVVVVLENDSRYKDHILFDEFGQRAFVTGPLPWDPGGGPRRLWDDADDAQLIRFMEKDYGLGGKEKVLMGLTAYLDSHAVNEVQAYFNALTWDGVCRLDRLFIDYLGAEDTPYIRAVTRKSFCAAVARAYRPGTKYDYVPILHGAQGIGKSTVLAVMGGAWYTDSLDTFEGKDAAELIQGRLIAELGELSALNRSDMEQAKHFISKLDDQFRVPYGRLVNTFPRRCTFFGTTNRGDPLRDPTGNRRWWPVDCDAARRVKSPWVDLPEERDQLWAEAVARCKLIGEALYLPAELETVAAEQQREHMESDPRVAMVMEFLERPLPLDWAKRSITERRMYWAGEFGTERGVEVATESRQTVSRQEIWAECFNRERAIFGRREAAEVEAIMAVIPGWARHTSSFRNGPYGTEKGYERVR